MLQRYAHAIDALAFPLPQGFSSFITYLGYKVMSATVFNQHIRCNTFLLNIDVMKKILAGIQLFNIKINTILYLKNCSGVLKLLLIIAYIFY